MMWETSALQRNGRLPAVGGGREAMANDALVSMFVKIANLHPVCQKKGKTREVTWNFGESPPTIVMVLCLHVSTQMRNLPVLELAFPFPVLAPISSTVLFGFHFRNFSIWYGT
jgi:hypothetical protein